MVFVQPTLEKFLGYNQFKNHKLLNKPDPSHFKSFNKTHLQ